MRLSRVHRSLCLAAILALTACGDDARLSVSTQPMPAPLNTAEVRYRIDAGVLSRTASLPTTLVAGTRATREFDTPTSGTARVSFSMVLPGGREVSSGEATVNLRGDWVWDFELTASTEDPRKRCFGCFGSKAFPVPADLRTAGRDSVWLVWGGNAIKHPVVY